MSSLHIDTSQNVNLQFEVAGLGDRMLAALIDYLALGAYAVGALLLIVPFLSSSEPLAMAILFAIVYLPMMFYFLLCEIFLDGQSIGKRKMNVKVVRLDGSPPTVGNYLLRWVLRPIDIMLANGLVAVVSILVTEHGQRLGDLAAGTTVVKLTRSTSLDDTLYLDVDDDYTPTFNDAHRLSDEDVRTAKRVLRAVESGTASDELAPRAKAALERSLGVTSDLPPVTFLETIVRDFNATVR